MNHAYTSRTAIPPCCVRIYANTTPKQRKYLKYGIFVVLALLVLGLMRFRATSCGAEDHLKALMIHTARIFNQNKITYWLDYGTMLGAVREKGIIGWEYDVDFGMPEDFCEKASTEEVRDQFSRLGLTLYNKTDYIPQKVKFTYDDQLKAFGYSSGYMSVPCLRVYDNSLLYFVDIYWYKPVSKEKAKATPPGDILLPKGYDYSEDLLCNAEGLHKEEFFPGGCRPLSSLLPTSTMSLFNEEFSLPAQPEANLKLMYGPNWHVPKAKGINAIMCQGKLPGAIGGDDWAPTV